MPGLAQLKQFSDDVKNLGGELEIRTERGEPIPTVPLPQGISDADDSDDFALGIPQGETPDTPDIPQSEPEFRFDDSALSPESTEIEEPESVEEEPAVPEEDLIPPEPVVPDIEETTAEEEAAEEEAAEEGAAEEGAGVPEEMPEEEAVAPEPVEEEVIPPESEEESENAEPVEEDLELPEEDSPPPEEEVTQPEAEEEIEEPAPETPEEIPEAEDSETPEEETEESAEPNVEPVAEESPAADAGEGSITDMGGFDIPSGLNQNDETDYERGDAASSISLEDDEEITLTEAELAAFQKNLLTYPLNLRIAVEELVIDDNYHNSIILDIIQQVIKRVAARKLANQMEKLAGISISVPRDFEHRSAEYYAQYRQTAEYQIKNKIIPAAIIILVLAAAGYAIFSAIRYFLYQPLMAERLYKEGYALIENGFYPQSEEKFDAALKYRVKRDWFFKYADGYRKKQQFDRAELMYRNLLIRYNHDKEAGLRFAEMELYDRGNFKRAEEVVRREVLDYHINDSDGMLLLGDIALEWGTEERLDAKFEEARETYSTLIQMYGAQDTYLARMMRYFIRTDNLREVLPLKSHFMAQKKITLNGQDLVELSGFLLEKLFGYLAPADEYLRVQIEDTHDLLEMAMKAAPENPDSRYNLGRYYIFAGNRTSAKLMLEDALPVFADSSNKNRRTTEHYINTHRLLGELYFSEREYIRAEELYRSGLSIFETDAALHGFQATTDVGNLYADLADIDYFISYDTDDALRNYQNAIDRQYDTPSVRYRVGYLNYTKGNYLNAVGSFIKTHDDLPNDDHVLLALGNVLALRSDNHPAEGYLTTLLDQLTLERERYGSVFPQVREDHYDLVDMYMKAANNLGVVLYRQTLQSGGSDKSAQALTWLSESLRAWDALTRNPQTMVRMEGSNLAERNIKYITYPDAPYEPELYTAIPRVLVGEKIPQ